MRAVEDPEEIAVSSSTEWVRKHSQDKIKLDFYSRKQKVEHVAKAVNSTLAVLSPQSKVHTVSQTCSKSLSPTSRCNVASKIIGIHYLILIRQFLTNVIKYRTVHDGLFSEALWKKQEEVGSKPGKQIDKSVGNLWHMHQKKT